MLVLWLCIPSFCFNCFVISVYVSFEFDLIVSPLGMAYLTDDMTYGAQSCLLVLVFVCFTECW